MLAPITRSCDFQLQLQSRSKQSFKSYYQHYAEGNFIHHLSHRWQMIFGYRLAWRQVNTKQWENEKIPHVAITKNFTACHSTISLRQRFEYRSRKHLWFWRQKISCTFPQKMTSFALNPHIYGEIYFKKGNTLNQGRLFLGIKTHALQIGFLKRIMRSNTKWTLTNIVSVDFQWQF